jgi:hypothetical protein
MDGSRAQLVRQPVGRSVATGGLVAVAGATRQRAARREFASPQGEGRWISGNDVPKQGKAADTAERVNDSAAD